MTQAYLSMVERGARPVSTEYAAKALTVFELAATAIPFRDHQVQLSPATSFAEALGSLGYPGFAYLPESDRLNPAELLMEALDSDDLDSRVTEALPWLPLTFPNLDWKWLTPQAKIRDRQNRLAFVVNLATHLAMRKRDTALAEALAERVDCLESSRLVAEDTLCKSSLTQAERCWLRTNRSESAEHWNLLTDLKVEHLDQAFV